MRGMAHDEAHDADRDARRAERDQRARAARQATLTDAYALLGKPEIQRLIGHRSGDRPLSRATLYRWVRDGQFPPPDRILPGGRSVWLRRTYDTWSGGGR